MGKKIKFRRKLSKEMVKVSRLMSSEKSDRWCLNASIIFTNYYTTVLSQWIKWSWCTLTFSDLSLKKISNLFLPNVIELHDILCGKDIFGL